MKNDVKIEHRLPTVAEFIKLRSQTDWGVPEPHVVAAVLNRSFSGIVAIDGVQTIGMARTVGDGHLILYIQDVIIAAAYRKQGVGRRLIEALLAALDENCAKDCTVGLFAAIGQTAFYGKLGFSERGNKAYGPGMHGTLSELAKPRSEA